MEIHYLNTSLNRSLGSPTESAWIKVIVIQKFMGNSLTLGIIVWCTKINNVSKQFDELVEYVFHFKTKLLKNSYFKYVFDEFNISSRSKHVIIRGKGPFFSIAKR